LASLDAAARRRALETLFSFDLPCVVISKGQDPPPELVELARARGTAVIRTRLKTAEFYRRLKPFLDEVFAPSTSVHASLADVFGVGLLFLGKSGIGKSECVLDLVERGHRLVADDVVHITRRGNDLLIGRGHELAQHYMEIRGIGLIDIRAYSACGRCGSRSGSRSSCSSTRGTRAASTTAPGSTVRRRGCSTSPSRWSRCRSTPART